jgi:hypothetical protein
MNYKKMWNTLKAEVGGRWCQPHPCSKVLNTIGELMINMERRATDEMKTKPEIKYKRNRSKKINAKN